MTTTDDRRAARAAVVAATWSAFDASPDLADTDRWDRAAVAEAIAEAAERSGHTHAAKLRALRLAADDAATRVPVVAAALHALPVDLSAEVRAARLRTAARAASRVLAAA